MLLVLVQMGLLIACGFAWKQWAPRHIPALAHRRALTDLVFFILLPALVLSRVLWEMKPITPRDQLECQFEPW